MVQKGKGKCLCILEKQTACRLRKEPTCCLFTFDFRFLFKWVNGAACG